MTFLVGFSCFFSMQIYIDFIWLHTFRRFVFLQAPKDLNWYSYWSTNLFDEIFGPDLLLCLLYIQVGVKFRHVHRIFLWGIAFIPDDRCDLSIYIQVFFPDSMLLSHSNPISYRIHRRLLKTHITDTYSQNFFFITNYIFRYV